MVVPQYKWAKEVKEMDGRRCVYCGSSERLEAHHIKPVHIYPKLGLTVENGVTLCRKCHIIIHLGHKSDDTTLLIGTNSLTDVIRNYVLNINADTDIISVKIPKGKREVYKKFAESQGKSLAGMIMELIEAEMQKEGR